MQNAAKSPLPQWNAAQQDNAHLLQALARPEAFPTAVPADAVVCTVQTHASAVLLAGDRAYKLKKPVNFGFLDYSTPALRRHYCGAEVRLNRRLAPGVYCGVAPILHLPDGRYRFGLTHSPEESPPPDAELAGGRVVDYAVVMLRLPEEATLEALVRSGGADDALLSEVARRVAAFHLAAPTNAHIAGFGATAVIQANWDENFAQLRPYIGRALDAPTYEQLQEYVYGFLERRAPLFAGRVRDGRIRDCHGDLRLQHVYRLDDLPALRHGPNRSQSTIAVIDCIEFNERFRYGDVASEVAFLSMELDAAGRPDLARTFTDAYIDATSDEALRELLPFYACYRACVRGKVLAFQLDEQEVPVAQREIGGAQAQGLLQLAARYATGATPPMLVMVGGLMGTGKSTLAQALNREQGWALISSDAVRKRLAGLRPADPQNVAFGHGIYSRAWTERTYAALAEEARSALRDGRSVVLDASFARRADRQALARAATTQGARCVFVECRCPRRVALERLAGRWEDRVRHQHTAAHLASVASDGRPAIYDAQRATWEAFEEPREQGVERVTLSTTDAIAVSVEHLLSALGIQRDVCWLS